MTAVPTWFSYMGVFNEADYVEYELRPDLMDDTMYLFNSSSQLIRPNGFFTGGVRVSWTNPNMGWKVGAKTNWGLATTTPNGDVQITQNYDAFRAVVDHVNPGSWLSGKSVQSWPNEPKPRCDANAEEMKNRTLVAFSSDANNITLPTEWALPTRPPGLDALVSNGVNGKRGRLVDVTVTTIAHAIRDSKGNLVTDLVLKPSSGEARGPTGSTAASATPVSSNKLSTGAKAGIGVGATIDGLALIGATAFFQRRRRKNRKTLSRTRRRILQIRRMDTTRRS
jgi:hypothetical protein